MSSDLETAKGLNYLLSFIIVILVSVLMNLSFPARTIKSNTLPPPIVKTEVIIKEIKVKSAPLINLSNNEKAALFLAVPFGGMIWVTVLALLKNRKERDAVVF